MTVPSFMHVQTQTDNSGVVISIQQNYGYKYMSSAKNGRMVVTLEQFFFTYLNREWSVVVHPKNFFAVLPGGGVAN